MLKVRTKTCLDKTIPLKVCKRKEDSLGANERQSGMDETIFLRFAVYWSVVSRQVSILHVAKLQFIIIILFANLSYSNLTM